MSCRDRGGIRKSLRNAAILGLVLIMLGACPDIFFAEGRSESFLGELQALDATFQQVLNQLDRSAEQSEEVSREVQRLKSQGAPGLLGQLRLEALLSRLREILLDRRELKKLERDLQAERRKKIGLLYDLIGKEIDSLVREAEEWLRRGEAQRAEQVHRALLAKMQMREALKKTASIHIGALLAIDLTGLEGASPPERREVAILMRNDAEMLDKKRNEMEEERRLLQEELKLKKTLSRLQGFPRGIENKPIKDQTKALEDRLLILDQAIDRYAERIQTLFAVSDQMLAGSLTEKDPLR